MKKEKITFTYRKVTDVSLVNIKQELNRNWNAEMCDLDTNEAFQYLADKINLALENNCPLKTRTISSKDIIREPWMTTGLLNSSRKLARITV